MYVYRTSFAPYVSQFKELRLLRGARNGICYKQLMVLKRCVFKFGWKVFKFIAERRFSDGVFQTMADTIVHLDDLSLSVFY